MLHPGDSAPNFQIPNQHGQNETLPDNHWALLYFYPRDDTPGCTLEACALRDLYHELSQYLIIFGVSDDPLDKHQQFAEKHQLPFSLLADTNHQIIEPYQAWGEKTLFGKTITGIQRISYIINPQHQIAKAYSIVNPIKHASQVLEDIKQLTSQ